MFKYIKFFVLIIFLFNFISESEAATINAASCSYSDVSSAVAAASTGDTVLVPEGSATWSSGLNINKGISLIGAGIGNTVITAGSGSMISYAPSDPSANALFRLSGFTLDFAGAHDGLFLTSGNTLILQTKVRIDHNKFQNIPTGSSQYQFIHYRGLRGVIDNNIFGACTYPLRTETSPLFIDNRPSGGQYLCGGIVEWDNFEGVKFGAVDNNIYFEDNVFEGVDWIVTDCQQGQRYAYRYNTINLTANVYPLFDMHGNQGSQFYSTMGAEIYGNNITSYGGTFLDHRGGRAFVFCNNAAENMAFQIREEFADSNSPVNYVGPNPPQYPQHVNGSYYWGNRKDLNGSLITAYIMTDCSQCYENGLAENVDFWQDAASFNGTSGVGCGTLANRPTTCTPGVAYWATNQSCTDLTGMVGAHPATPISGTLYKCIAANTWDSGSSPLPYPHPLVTGEDPPQDDTTPPTDIVTVNDGPAGDIDSTSLTTELSANWAPSTDGESSISKYWYAIGTTAGGTDTAEWASTSNGTVTSVTRSSLLLTTGVTYYFTVKAENGVSLQSNPASSDGQCVVGGGPGGDDTPGEIDVKVYPNPLVISEGSQITFSVSGTTGGEVKIYTVSGKLVKELVIQSGVSGVNWDILNEEGNSIKAGLYVYSITDGEGNKKTGKLAISSN
jgi:hypothetical protein